MSAQRVGRRSRAVATFFSTVLSGAGWAAMGGAAINALIAPWFVRLRPPALSWAYNAASIGGHPPPQQC